jgi:hypothetical protein
VNKQRSTKAYYVVGPTSLASMTMGELMSWTFRLKDNELKDILDQYLTKRDEEGRGGNARFKLFMSKNGKPCLSIWDPNSAAAQERQNTQAKDGAAKADDLPF